jgi:multiple sugar transport system substrate-binding protein
MAIRRTISALLYIPLLLVAGCSDGNEDGRTVIRYARWGGPEELGAEKKLVAEFERLNPDIKVKTEFASWPDYWGKLQSQMASGTAPDVFMLTGAFAHEYQIRNQMEDLTEYVANDPTVNFDDYYQVSVDTYNFRGGFWALPRDCNTGAMLYNKTIFDRYGVEYPKDGWTWEDFLQKARALTVDDDNDGRFDSYGYLSIYGSMEINYGPWIWQNGGEIINEDRTKCLINSPESIEAIQFLYDLVAVENVSPDSSQSMALGGLLFITGRYAMVQGGSWMINTYSEIDTFEWDIAPMPRGKAGSVACVNGLGVSIYSKSEKKDAAWRFAKFFGSREYQEALAKSGTSIPVLRSVAESEIYLDGHPEGKKYYLQQLENAHPMDFVPGFPKIDNAIRNQLELVWLGQKDVPTALDDATEEVDEILKDSQVKIRENLRQRGLEKE